MNTIASISYALNIALASLSLTYYFKMNRPKVNGLRFVPYILILMPIEFAPIALLPQIQYKLRLPWSIFIPASEMLAVSFLFLFTLELGNKKALSQKEILLFLTPGVILAVSNFPFYVSEILSFNFVNTTIINIRMLANIAITLFFVVTIIRRRLMQWRATYRAQTILIYVIFFQFVVVFLYFTVLFVRINFFNLVIKNKLSVLSFLLSTITLLLFYIYIFRLYNNLQHKNARIKQERFQHLHKIESIKQSEIDNKAEASPQSDAETETETEMAQHTAIENKINTFFEENHTIYLDSTFNLGQLALLIEIPRHDITIFFQESHNTSFPKFLNEKRITYACELLNDPNYNASISELTKHSGYRSRTSFYKNFKEITGMLPLEYRKSKGLT